MNSERSAGTGPDFCRLYSLYSCIDVSRPPNEGTRRTAAVPTLLDDDVRILAVAAKQQILRRGFRRIRGGRTRQAFAGATRHRRYACN